MLLKHLNFDDTTKNNMATPTGGEAARAREVGAGGEAAQGGRV